jgi:hypothetical protein
MGLRGPKSFNEKMATAQRRRVHVAHRAVNPAEPPSHLAAPTREWWAGIASSLEVHQLRILTCAGEDMKETAMAVLAEHGLSFEDDRGMIRARPEAAIARDSRAAFLRAVAQLKLDVPPPKSNRNGHGLGISWENLPHHDE